MTTLETAAQNLERWTGPGGICAFLEQHYVLENNQRIKLEPWQREILTNVGETRRPDGRRQYTQALIGLPRKNGKSTLSGGVGFYELIVGGLQAVVAGELPAEIYSCATDQDQARIIFEKAKKAVLRSKFRGACQVLRDSIHVPETDARYTVLSADAPSAYGLNPSLVLFDELALQPSRELWDAMSTAFGARPNGLIFATTTAGFDFNSIGYEIYERLSKGQDPHGYIFWSEGDVAEANLASWIDLAELEIERTRLPAHVFQRLHENRWTRGAGSLLSPEVVEAIFDPALTRQTAGKGEAYVYACDLGLRTDRTASVIAHWEPAAGVVVIDRIRLWQGADFPGGEVLISEVEKDMRLCYDTFRLRKIIVDPWQLQSTRQALEGYYPIEEFTFTASSVARLSQNLFSLANDGRLRCYPHTGFKEELHDLQAVEKSYGWRIQHESGRHDDIVMAVGMAALYAREMGTRSKVMVTIDGEPILGFDDPPTAQPTDQYGNPLAGIHVVAALPYQPAPLPTPQDQMAELRRRIAQAKQRIL